MGQQSYAQGTLFIIDAYGHNPHPQQDAVATDPPNRARLALPRACTRARMHASGVARGPDFNIKEVHWSANQGGGLAGYVGGLANVVPRGLEPRTLRLLAVRSNQLSYETNCALFPWRARRHFVGKGRAVFDPMACFVVGGVIAEKKHPPWGSNPRPQG